MRILNRIVGVICILSFVVLAVSIVGLCLFWVGMYNPPPHLVAKAHVIQPMFIWGIVIGLFGFGWTFPFALCWAGKGA